MDITDALVGGPSVDRENPFSYDVYNNFLSTNEIENYGGSAQIDYELGNLALTSITAYSQARAAPNPALCFSAADLIGAQRGYVAIAHITIASARWRVRGRQ